MTSDQSFLSHEELLGGLPARRASTLLFAIEGRTVHLVAQARAATDIYLTDQAAEEREREFLSSLAGGRDLSLKPSIRNLERYALQWAALVPDDANVKATTVHLMSEKYVLTQSAIRRIRVALSLDSEPVQEAYQRLYGRPIETIYTPGISPGEWVRNATARLATWLEDLPPFWMAFALTLPVGPGLLALPIAVAGIGALPGLAILIIMGAISMLTVAAMAEAVARGGSIRFGQVFLGRWVEEFLGSAGSSIFSLILAFDLFLLLIAFYLGVAGTLADATRIPASVWAALLFLAGLYFLSRKSLNATPALTLLVGALNVGLILTLTLLTAPYVQAQNLEYNNLPFANGRAFEPAGIQLVFGVILGSYFSHLLVGNYGKTILRRDPGAQSFIWGSVASIAFTMVLSGLWVLAINGSLAPTALMGETGTVLIPLAAKVGPAAQVIGALFVVVSLGIAAIQTSLGLFFAARERLPGAGGPGSRRRFLSSISPAVVAFLLAEWMIFTGEGSFSGLFGFLGAVAVPVFAGILPVLLLAAGRRKGELAPQPVFRFLGHPLVVVGLYVVFVASIFLHGLVIWQDPLQQAVAIATGGLVLVATFAMLQRGAFEPRIVVELRDDQSFGGQSMFNVTDNGRATGAQVSLYYTRSEDDRHYHAATGAIPIFTSLIAATFQLPATSTRQLKVWAHRITAEGNSESLPARIEVQCGEVTHRVGAQQPVQQTVLSLDGPTCEVHIVLD